MEEITHVEFWKVYRSRKPGPLGHYTYKMEAKIHRADVEPVMLPLDQAHTVEGFSAVWQEGRAAWREENPDSKSLPVWCASAGGDFDLPKRGLRYRLGTLYASGLFRRG